MFFGFGRTSENEKFIQLTPFVTISEMFSEADNYKQFIINILGNIILFIPFGFLGIIFEKLKKLKNLLPIFIIAISIIELLQYITNKVFADIDDVIINTIGVAIGFWIYNKVKLTSSSKRNSKVI